MIGHGNLHNVKGKISIRNESIKFIIVSFYVYFVQWHADYYWWMATAYRLTDNYLFTMFPLSI